MSLMYASHQGNGFQGQSGGGRSRRTVTAREGCNLAIAVAIEGLAAYELAHPDAV
jgi:hypothetical protein